MELLTFPTPGLRQASVVDLMLVSSAGWSWSCDASSEFISPTSAEFSDHYPILLDIA